MPMDGGQSRVKESRCGEWRSEADVEMDINITRCSQGDRDSDWTTASRQNLQPRRVTSTSGTSTHVQESKVVLHTANSMETGGKVLLLGI